MDRWETASVLFCLEATFDREQSDDWVNAFEVVTPLAKRSRLRVFVQRTIPEAADATPDLAKDVAAAAEFMLSTGLDRGFDAGNRCSFLLAKKALIWKKKSDGGKRTECLSMKAELRGTAQKASTRPLQELLKDDDNRPITLAKWDGNSDV